MAAAPSSGPDFFTLPQAESPLFLYRGGENGDATAPTLLRDAGDATAAYHKDTSFPHAQYRSRGQEAKTAVHWGQRKLLISEMQLLTYYCEPGVPHWIVYVGAAPGSHLMFLDRLYGSKHAWELVDPGLWDHRYASLPAQQKRRFNLRNEFFDNTQAYELAERRLVKAKCPALSLLVGAMVDDANALVNAGSEEAVVHTEGTDAEAARTEDIPIKYKTPLDLKPHGLAALTAVTNSTGVARRPATCSRSQLLYKKKPYYKYHTPPFTHQSPVPNSAPDPRARPVYDPSTPSSARAAPSSFLLA